MHADDGLEGRLIETGLAVDADDVIVVLFYRDGALRRLLRLLFHCDRLRALARAVELREQPTKISARRLLSERCNELPELGAATADACRLLLPLLLHAHNM